MHLSVYLRHGQFYAAAEAEATDINPCMSSHCGQALGTLPQILCDVATSRGLAVTHGAFFASSHRGSSVSLCFDVKQQCATAVPI